MVGIWLKEKRSCMRAVQASNFWSLCEWLPYAKISVSQGGMKRVSASSHANIIRRSFT